MKPILSFFAQFRQVFFKWRLEQEIYHDIFPHLESEKDAGYSFRSDKQMNAQTEVFAVHALFERIDRQTYKMPKAYGESFRHIMHRDLHKRLRMYEQLARRRIQPASCHPRFIATRA